MYESGRRVLRTAAAVAGVTALSAAATGTAFADVTGGEHNARATTGASEDSAALSGGASDGASDSASDGADLHAFEMPSLSRTNVRKESRNRDHDSTGGYDADVDGDGDSDQDVRDDPHDDYDGPYKHFYDDDEHLDLDRGDYKNYGADDDEGDDENDYCDDERQYKKDSRGFPALASKPYPDADYCD